MRGVQALMAPRNVQLTDARLRNAVFIRIEPTTPGARHETLRYRPGCHPTDSAPSETALETFTQSVATDAPIHGRRLALVVISHGNGGSFAGHYDTALALAPIICSEHTGFDRVAFHSQFNADVVSFFRRTLQ
jgi:predicted dienelactone hydrolase